MIRKQAEFDINEIVPYIPRASVVGDYIYNPDPESDNHGWMAGLIVGSKKVKDWGDWSAMYLYRRLEKDAWIDTLPDSNAFEGKTGIKGHEGKVTFGLTKDTTFGFD